MSTGAVSKFDYARKLAAALCYVGLVRLDTIAFSPSLDDLGDSFLCGGGRHRFIPAVNFLENLEAGRSNQLLPGRARSSFPRIPSAAS